MTISMKGDLSTVRKVSRYASAVMAGGGAVLGACMIAVACIGIWSMFSEDGAEMLSGILHTEGNAVAACVELLVILGLGLFTVTTVRGLMVNIMREHSPFNHENTRRLKLLSIVYLICSFVLAATDVANTGFSVYTLFLFFGSLLVCVVMYCLSCVFNYGSVLQRESDETL